MLEVIVPVFRIGGGFGKWLVLGTYSDITSSANGSLWSIAYTFILCGKRTIQTEGVWTLQRIDDDHDNMTLIHFEP